MDQLVAICIDGVIYSSWLFTSAIGLTLIYGVMKILNITHGSFYALGAYTALLFGLARFCSGSRFDCCALSRAWAIAIYVCEGRGCHHVDHLRMFFDA